MRFRRFFCVQCATRYLKTEPNTTKHNKYRETQINKSEARADLRTPPPRPQLGAAAEARRQRACSSDATLGGHRIMRLVSLRGTHRELVPLSATRAYSGEEVRALMCSRWESGAQLALDFSGEYVPVCLQEEAALAATLVATYHNSCVVANIEVSKRTRLQAGTALHI